MKIVPMKGWSNLQSLSWSADGNHLYVTAFRDNYSLLYVDLAGEVNVLLNEAVSQAWVGSPLASPDGTHVIFNETTWESNAVMLENF